MTMKDQRKRATVLSAQTAALAILGGLAIWKIHWIIGAALFVGAVVLGVRWFKHRAQWGMRF